MGEKILGIIGSPRKNGNTEILIDHVLKGAVESGAQTEKINLYNQKLNPCVGCSKCLNSAKCIHDDDMDMISEKIGDADVLVFGTPVYFGAPTGMFKIFMDRWFSPHVRKKFKGKKVIITMPLAEAEGTQDSKQTINIIKGALEFLGATDIRNIIVAYETGEKGEVMEKTEVLNEAYRSGKEIIESRK